MDIEQSIRTYTYEDGEIQRVQLVKASPLGNPDFFAPSFSADAFNSIIDIIDRFQVSRYPMLFGTMIFFRIPDDVEVPVCAELKKYGDVTDKNVLASVLFKHRFKGGRFVPANDAELCFVDNLKAAGTFRVLKGRRSKVVPMPFSDHFGRMSSVEENASFKVNSNFFVMDSFDCATVYDSVGTPLGLCVKDGRVLNPPLFRREALIFRKAGASVAIPRLTDCSFTVADTEFVPGSNCRISERPDCRITARSKGVDLVIVGTEIKAVKEGGRTEVPAGGFVLSTDKKDIPGVVSGAHVRVNGFEDVSFAVQCGNSIIKNGVPSGGFISGFYNIRKLFGTPYPPCFYPLDYANARAARIAIGSGSDGSLCFLWAEGAAKVGHEKGRDSRGASLSDMEIFCRDAGMLNAINLDGGGSAQILLNNRRSLCLSDRTEDGCERERGIPLGIIIR